MAMTKSGKNLENNKQNMGGCMAGFFNFSHLLSGKRPHLKRLLPPLSPSDDSENPTSEPISSAGSLTLSKALDKSQLQHSPESALRSRAPDPGSVPAPKSPVPAVSTLEFKEAVKSPWKFNREAPRLSLDSRAIVDAKGGLRPREIRISSGAGGVDKSENQRRSPCVIARLMGLEPPPCTETEKKLELRRSTSESRSRDYRFLDTPSFLSSVRNEVAGERKSAQSAVNRSCNANNNVAKSNLRMKNQHQNQNQINQRRLMAESRSYYNTADFFPPEIPAKQRQQKNEAVTIFGEIERRLRMRGIDDPSKDLETFKHILEALQLKGLLHSSAATTTTTAPRRNLVSDREAPISVMGPGRASLPPRAHRRKLNTSSCEPSVSPRRERPARTPGRSDNRSSSPPVRRGGPLSVETQRRSSHSPIQSPKTTKRYDQNQTVNRSPRGRRSTVEICRGERFSRRGPAAEDEASTVSESSFSTSTPTENERWRGEDYGEGRSLLERCDKLLSSIADMNSNSNLNLNLIELQQPSPVSVLDSSFYNEEELSPSPVKKRSIDFKDQVILDLEDELWSPSSLSSSSSSRPHLPDHHYHHHGHASDHHPSTSSDDPDFIYVSEVLRASYYLPDEPDLFLLLEKQISLRPNQEDPNPKASFLQRKLIFDTIAEILDRSRHLPPWKSGPSRLSLRRVWAEFRRIRERGPGQDPLEIITGVLKKDLAEDSTNGWGDCPVEMSEAVLDIERLIFKDLIGESIQDLAALALSNVGGQKLCRKLVF